METIAPATTIESHAALSLRVTGEAYHMYRGAFTEIAKRAVQCHLMKESEFYEIAEDPRITKYVARLGDEIVGLSLLTNNLHAWPLISAPYFETHFPDHYAAGSVWYVGFVAVKPQGRAHQLFPRMIAAMYEPVIASGGIAVMDFCGVNVDDLNLPRATSLILKRINPLAGGHMLDRQEFWAWDFAGEL